MTEAQRRYQEYLRSPHWQAMRERILERANEHCEWCGRFAGKNPHGPHCDMDLEDCEDPNCEFCRFYFEDRYRNDCELQCLEVHHLTYERRGHEHLTDLVALCWGCHESTWDDDRHAWQMFVEAPYVETVF